MKYRLAFQHFTPALLLAFLVIGTEPLAAFARRTGDACMPVPVGSQAAPNAEIRLSGELRLCERENGDSLSYWTEGTLEVSNNGSRATTAVVVTAWVQYAHGERGSYTLQLDGFPFERSVMPVASSVHFDVKPIVKVSHSAARRVLRPAAVSAVGTVVYVEFGDGTSLGSAPTDLLERRLEAVAALRAPQSAYLSEGSEGFLRALQQGSGRADIDHYFKGLLTRQHQAGSETVVEELRVLTARAAEHRSAP